VLGVCGVQGWAAHEDTSTIIGATCQELHTPVWKDWALCQSEFVAQLRSVVYYEMQALSVGVKGEWVAASK
jgi:hypothetical protein